MLVGLALFAVVLIVLLGPGGTASQRATVQELASARAIAAARLRQFEDERQERFRLYHRVWGAGGSRRSCGRGYVSPFTAETRRG